jgi:hypothetical protein
MLRAKPLDGSLGVAELVVQGSKLGGLHRAERVLVISNALGRGIKSLGKL